MDIRKAKYVYKRMNDDEVRVDEENILSKLFPDSSRCEVVVSTENPMIWKYNKNSETLTLSFHYGFWNAFGIAQH